MPPEKLRTMCVGAVGELELLQQFVGAPLPLARALPEVGAVKQQDLARRQGEIQVGPLRHHADQPLGLHLLLPHVVFADEGAPAGGLRARGQDADGGRFSGAIRPEQPEDFARADFEARRRRAPPLRTSSFFSFFAERTGREGEAAAPRRHGRRRVINLAQILDADADSHLRPCHRIITVPVHCAPFHGALDRVSASRIESACGAIQPVSPRRTSLLCGRKSSAR